VLTLGPKHAEQVLKRGIGMGADSGIHLLAEDDLFPDPYPTTFLMAEYARDKGYDLILTGVMSEDLMQGQVGPMLGEMLSMNCATAVIATQISSDFSTVYVEREIEGGAREGWELTLPALLTIQTGINKPRYPALSQLLRAARQKAEVIKGERLGSPLARQVVTKTAIPEKQRRGLTLRGSSHDKAEALMTIFLEKGFFKGL
ncbi:MAG: electron transfer flavoprotein subunit beta/FixA family protein, partial [Deltaproteobacteria bacterium]|nr:electron transfer flavoprotein subunit beta/FixA family protein [Deltaproteobacteria bacterium]